jgi:curved DNA-binding protein CbpA
MADEAPVNERPIADVVREKHQQLKAGDYFALLGVPRGADAATVKNAYFQLARLLHPDALARQNLGDLSKPALEVFKSLAEAYATLTDRRRRAEYEARMAQGQGGAMTSEEKVKRDATSEARIWYHKGQMLMQRRGIEEAEACYRKAVELAPKETRYQSLLAWAVMNNETKPLLPRLEEARQLLQRVLESANDDASGDVYYYMAMYHKAKGEDAKQRTFLSDCLNVNSKHVDALREQRLLAMRARQRKASPLEQAINKLIEKFKNRT